MGTSVRSGSRGGSWCLFSTVTSCQAVFRMSASEEEEAPWRARLRRRISSLLPFTSSLDAMFFLPRYTPMQVHMSCVSLPTSPICARRGGGVGVFFFIWGRVFFFLGWGCLLEVDDAVLDGLAVRGPRGQL